MYVPPPSLSLCTGNCPAEYPAEKAARAGGGVGEGGDWSVGFQYKLNSGLAGLVASLCLLRALSHTLFLSHTAEGGRGVPQ